LRVYPTFLHGNGNDGDKGAQPTAPHGR